MQERQERAAPNKGNLYSRFLSCIRIIIKLDHGGGGGGCGGDNGGGGDGGGDLSGDDHLMLRTDLQNLL